MHLDVPAWQRDPRDPWKFDIEPRSPNAAGTTEIVITDLYPAVKNRLGDTMFSSGLETRVSRAYSYFISRIIQIEVDGHLITTDQIQIGSNKATELFDVDDVSILIEAGIGIPGGDNRYSSETAGWNVYCNGRQVIFFDKTELTGWGLDGYLPQFQPKHRPFVGLVFFSSETPKSLPWTTTKLGINPDNIVWQRSLTKMADVARQVTRFLDKVYGEDGTTITRDELTDAIGTAEVSVPRREATVSVFRAPVRSAPTTTTVQYKVDRKLLSEAKEATGSRSMSNSEIGRYTFDYFVENEMK